MFVVPAIELTLSTAESYSDCSSRLISGSRERSFGGRFLMMYDLMIKKAAPIGAASLLSV